MAGHYPPAVLTVRSAIPFPHSGADALHPFGSGVTVKIIPRALSAGLALAAVPAQAFVTYQDIVSAATNPDDLSRRALVTILATWSQIPDSQQQHHHRQPVHGV